MLRSNDLIWSYVVSKLLKGQTALLRLLHWNSDATRMPAANHSYYLRNCYLENRLSSGSMVLDNTLLDLSKVKVPVYNLANPRGSHRAGGFGAVRFAVLTAARSIRAVGSGHIAGVVNPPASGKYQYWTTTPIKDSTRRWIKNATEQQGSWWPDWRECFKPSTPRPCLRGRSKDRGDAADRGCARQLRPRQRVAQARAVRYNLISVPGFENE